ncbi:MAG: alpha-L-fucosidase [Clostridia bacterium]|nr:alpha-L-fucosidase [Clostridia bacterium]MBQ4603469.1 alpha-L-fucosidase [Clostridia bacterium]
MSRTPDYIKYAASIVPSERQLKWQEMEFYAFIHFGINTFTNSEWGNGNEDPELFNPEKLDCRQWAKVCQLAGMKGIILTCKHHDGFCLWPSAYTDHSVRSSNWKEGRGDVVAECAKACAEFGLKFGVYLSPWDRHEPTYGSGETYNKFFKNQLRELLTAYGDLFCVWFDGACGEGPNGKVQEYDWEGYYKLIRELQPNAAISITGPDVRWCGNEAGVCRKSEWSVVPYWHSNHKIIAAASQHDVTKPPKKINPTALDLGSRKAIKKCNKLIWYPSEVDVSIRKGWFYHPEEDYSVKPLSKLMEIYYNSVGANASFLLNIPPTPEGKIHEKDIETLLSMGAQLEIDFNENLADDSVMTDSQHLDEKHTGQMALSHNPNEYWHSGENPEGSELILDIGDEYDIDKIVLGEHIRTGQQIEKFSLYAKINGKWKKLASETTIGYKRICRFKEIRVRYFKLVIEKARCFATISKFEAY